jgi:hypothetical protein
VPNDKYQRKMLNLEKQRLQESKKQHRENRTQNRRLEEKARAAETEDAIRRFNDRENTMFQYNTTYQQTERHHQENITLLERFQRNEWLRWKITTTIAVVALATAICSIILGLKL